MTKSIHKSLYIFSAGILVLLVLTIISLDRYGRNSRASGKGLSPSDPEIVKTFVDFPEDAYKLWKRAGFKGRVVVSVSRRLNFVRPEESSLTPPMPFPIKVFNILTIIEGGLKGESFLFVSMEAGIAREVIHIVPEEVFSEKLRYADKDEIGQGRINIPFSGSPRVITTMPFFSAEDEPILLYIDASFFREGKPEELLRQLLKAGVRTDYVILCRSFDDAEVSDKERQRLEMFGVLLGAGDRVNDPVGNDP